jgi:hypothetical protein
MPRSTLLSTLIPIRYEDAVNTIEDLDKSEMPFLITGKTAPHILGATDPRPAMQRIFNRSIIIPYNETFFGPWARDM